MADQLFLSCINVLDDSMMGWYKKWDPGFMRVSRKPHPFVNEQHTIACEITITMCRSKISEGKDRPAQLGAKKWSEIGKTVGLIIQMCNPIFVT